MNCGVALSCAVYSMPRALYGTCVLVEEEEEEEREGVV